MTKRRGGRTIEVGDDILPPNRRPLEEATLPATQKPPRFAPGQSITAPRSGRSVGVAVVLESHSTGTTEVYRVRWASGHETFFVPGPEVRDKPREPALTR